MRRFELPYLSTYQPVLPQQERAGEVIGPKDGKVHVLEHQDPWRYDAWRTERAGSMPVRSLFLVRTPQRRDEGLQFLFDNAGRQIQMSLRERCLVPCTAETCRRWAEGAIAYATVMDDISADLVAAHRRASSVPQWRRFAAPLALRKWEKTRRRYERVIREASEAYKPIGMEIWQAIDDEKSKAAENARQAKQAQRRRAELAERPVWVWSSVATNGRPTAHISRYDVSAGSRPAPTSPQVNGPVDLPALRQALEGLMPVQLEWDSTAITETERELEGVSFGSWWRELFSEDYRTFTSPPPNPSSSHPSIGGTGTSGSGGYAGGHGSFGGFGGY